MLRVYLKLGVNAGQASALCAAARAHEYKICHHSDTLQHFLLYEGDLLDVTADSPHEMPASSVDRVTFRTVTARFFRNDGLYQLGSTLITAKVVRAEKTGAPFQQVHISGSTVANVTEALSAFRRTADHKKLVVLEDWGNQKLSEL